MESNAKRFLDAFNQIDYALRTICKQKRNVSFSEAVRRSCQTNGVIRKYEDDLLDFARLRNCIVHSNNPRIVMAEPHTDVVEKIEKILNLITTPPLVLDIAKKEVVGVEGTKTIKDVLLLANLKGYSNIAIYENEAIIGVANLGILIKILSKVLANNQSIDNFIETTKIKDVASGLQDVFMIEDSSCTVEKALNLFAANRKLTCIIITKKGNFLEKPIGIVTVADIMDLNKILEDY